MKKEKEGSIETYRLISTLPKRDIVRLARNTCKHGHCYLAHPKCAYDEGIVVTKDGHKVLVKERIGFFDIENFSFQFKADMGIVLSYCIKELDGGIISNVITPEEAKSFNDKRLIQDMVRDLKKFTRVVGFYSTKFDIPFVRTRALMHKIDFPIYKELYHTDLYYNVKNKFKLRSNHLSNACKAFGIPAKYHPFEMEPWAKAMSGDKKALDYVLIHNKEDVISTELLWKKVSIYQDLNRRSI